jgi:hypothetical protein
LTSWVTTATNPGTDNRHATDRDTAAHQEDRHVRRSPRVVHTAEVTGSNPEPAVRAEHAAAWTRWEDAVLSLEPNARPALYQDGAEPDQIAFARICSWYAAHDGLGVGDTILEHAE